MMVTVGDDNFVLGHHRDSMATKVGQCKEKQGITYTPYMSMHFTTKIVTRKIIAKSFPSVCGKSLVTHYTLTNLRLKLNAWATFKHIFALFFRLSSRGGIPGSHSPSVLQHAQAQTFFPRGCTSSLFETDPSFLFALLFRWPVHGRQLVEPRAPSAQIFVLVLLVVCACLV